MMLIMNLFFYCILIVTTTTITITNVVAAATENVQQQQQKQQYLRSPVLKQNEKEHHEIKQEYLNVTASSTSSTTATTKTLMNKNALNRMNNDINNNDVDNKNTTSSTTKTMNNNALNRMNNDINDNNDVTNKNAIVKLRRQLTGQFTIVKANQLSESKLKDITLGTYNNGDIINIAGNIEKKFSMYIEHSGPMNYVNFQFYNTKKEYINKNSTSYEPFALSYHKGKKYDPIDILAVPGTYKINITGYMFGLKLSNIILSFTIIHDSKKPSSFKTITTTSTSKPIVSKKPKS